MPIILATQEAEIRKIKVQSQPGQINSSQDPTLKNPSQTNKQKKPKTDRVAQSKGPKFKPQYHKKKKLMPFFFF
jgi:hypothetical protein